MAPMPHHLQSWWRGISSRISTMPPTVRAGLTSAVVMGIGDSVSQLLVLRSTKHSGGPPTPHLEQLSASKHNTDLAATPKPAAPPAPAPAPGSGDKLLPWGQDPDRTARFMLVGLTLHGPYFYHAFRWLDNQFGPSRSLKTALVKSLVGQVTLFPVYVGAFFVYMGLLEGESVAGSFDKLKNGFGTTYRNGSVFWPLANIFNFMLVPPSGRVLYVNGMGLIWNAYLSWANAQLVLDKKRSAIDVNAPKK